MKEITKEPGNVSPSSGTWEAYWSGAKEIDLNDTVKHSTYYALFKGLLKRAGGLNNGIKILELGCGTGSCSLALAHEFPDKVESVVFVDFSQAVLNIVGATAAKYGLSSRIRLLNSAIFSRIIFKLFTATLGAFDIIFTPLLGKYFAKNIGVIVRKGKAG